MSITLGCSAPRGPMAIDLDAPEEFTTTESGLKYRILRKSDGPRPTPQDEVEVDYSGWLDNGTIFDSSYNSRKTAKFRLGNVVAGWTEGLQLIGEGGMIELEIPSELGYGASGSGSIPPNATLHFKVELHKIH
ncbi:FKBP-type peptidyl-prolyl cis-trans isomerase [Rubripirellula amarantea]|nr:FKBP-type peptidyl-prolyl cis-trans isomerase [Rubripirellula amarantea]MDA8743996.1 FKBP-type peptidyl-prolyl cis-trans isomerase [Rubripirellula amarantea]